jgi:hypothetical protein
MRIKYFAIGIVCGLTFILFTHYVNDLFFYYQYFDIPKTDSIEVGPVKVTLENCTDWTTVFKMLVVLLGGYGGIRLIDKYIK